jgi:peptidoglycan/LPS O-acetylase OafA/YrhL
VHGKQLQAPVYFEGLNALRAFSALAIIFYHTSLAFHNTMSATTKLFTHNLTFGVDLFFIISGFIIIYLLLLEKQTTQKIDFVKFYIRRALRILPLYFLVVGIAYVFYHKSHPEIDFSKFLYFWSNFWMIEKDAWTISILNPLWSLCIEEHFYLFIPFIIYLTPPKRVHFVLYGIILISILFRINIFYTVQYNWMNIYCHTLSRCDLMAVGGLLATYSLKNEHYKSIHSAVIYGAALHLILLMCVIDFAEYTTLTLTVFKKYLYVFPMVILFMGIVLNQDHSDRLLQFVRKSPVLEYLGKISFGLYMYHSIVSDNVQALPFLPKSYLAHSLAVVLVSIVVSAISYECFEKQILKLKTPFEVFKTKR